VKKVLFVLAIIFLIGFIVNSCDDDPKTPDPAPVCQCNPRVHGTEDECCDIGDCCTKNAFNGVTMSTGTQIQLADGVTGITGKQVEAKVYAAFDEIKSWGSEYIADADWAKDNIDIIRIIPGSGAVVQPKKENGKWVLELSMAYYNDDGVVQDIAGQLQAWAETQKALALFKHKDNPVYC